MTINAPRISVIIPVYNVEPYLSACLDSVIEQPFTDIEIICINNFSTDRSLDILREYEKKDRRIIVIDHDVKGLGTARNAGMERAQGEYITFLDSDDLFSPGILSLAYEKAVEEDLDFVRFGVKVFLEDQNVSKQYQDLCNYFSQSRSYNGVYSGKELFDLLNSNDDYYCVAWANLYRSSFLKKNQIRFFEFLHEDELFTWNTYLHAERCSCLSHEGYFYRIRENSIQTTKKGSDHLKGFYYSWLDMEQKIREVPENFEDKKAFIEYVWFLQRKAINLYTEIRGDFKEGKSPQTAQEKMIVFQLEMLYRSFLYERMKADLENILNSPTYKLARMIMWLPKKILKKK